MSLERYELQAVDDLEYGGAAVKWAVRHLFLDLKLLALVIFWRLFRSFPKRTPHVSPAELIA
jgi:hypothetical protein